jgi:hypothetical protein
MKKNYALIGFLLMAALAYGQQTVDLPAQKPVQKSPKVKAYEVQFYCCPQCDFISKVAGVCPNHQATLIKAGSYYCTSNYHYTSAKKGTCPEHHTALKEMEITYRKPATP